MAKTVLLLSEGEQHNGLLKALVPPLWLPHKCDADASWNNNVEGENQERGKGRGEKSLRGT